MKSMEPFAFIPGRYDDVQRRAEVDRAIGKRRRSTRHANLGLFTGYRIGLDIGNGNIGWCVLFEDGLQARFLTADDIARHNADLPPEARRTQLPDPARFVPMGTHKFQAREPGEKVERSFAKVRAEKRAERRLLDARQRHRLHVRKALEAAGLLPRPGDALAGHTEIPADRLRVRLLDPDFPAHPHDLGRALRLALRRRGYLKPIWRAGVDEESGFGDKAAADYRAALQQFECETVGGFLERCARDAQQDDQPFRKRHRPLSWQSSNRKLRPKEPLAARSYEVFRFLTPTFDLIREEVRLLRERQRDRVQVGDGDWARLEEAAEFRRSLKAKTPGNCRHLAQERRCVRALPGFQRFRILEQVANLRDQHGRPLGGTDFADAVRILEGVDKIGLAALQRELGAGQKLKLEGEDTGRRMLVGAKTDVALKAALGDIWMRLPIDQRNDWTMRFLRRPQWDESSDPNRDEPCWAAANEAELARDAEACFGRDALKIVDDKAAPAFEDSFAAVSLKAANILADAYERGLSHDERLAELARAGAQEPGLDLFERLPYYGRVMPDQIVPAKGFAPEERTCAEEWAFGRATNPDVHVVMNRLRAVINGIIDMMGGILPTTCVVEVARSAFSEDEANEHRKRMRERESLRAAIVKDIDKVFEGLDRRRPVGPGLDRLIDRWKAAIRQGWRDYDGSRIERSLLIDGTQYQLDHVVPAAFGDFRRNNLFVSRFNAVKGRRLPWEAFRDEPEFPPALLAFATFGLEQRIASLEEVLRFGRNLPRFRRERIEAGLERARRELNGLGDFGTPRPDVLTALRRTLTGSLEALIADGEDAGNSAAGGEPARSNPAIRRPCSADSIPTAARPRAGSPPATRRISAGPPSWRCAICVIWGRRWNRPGRGMFMRCAACSASTRNGPTCAITRSMRS
jgi:CRISPR-associated endonuclease Csn1